MEFLKYLDEMERFANADSTLRIFHPIDVGTRLRLSIQASELVSARPQKTLENLEEYTHMEVGFFKDDSFARFMDSIPDFLSIAELETYHSGEIYEGVPVDLIDELFQYLVLNRNERTYG
jgi:hypothetical protein